MTTPPRATPSSCAASLRSALISCVRQAALPRVLAGLSATELAFLASDWAVFARPDQLPPQTGRDGAPWRAWLVLGGRGAGKTRTGAEWVRGWRSATPRSPASRPAASPSSARRWPTPAR